MLTRKNKIQQIYYDNRQKCCEAYSLFDHLNRRDNPTPYLSSPLPLTDVKKVSSSVRGNKNKSNSKETKWLLPSMDPNLRKELEASILHKWSSMHQKNRALISQFKELNQKWLEKQDKLSKKKKKKTEEDRRYKPMTRHKKTLAEIPRMLTDEEKKYDFLSVNGFRDSETVLREYVEQRITETSWTQEEKDIFMQKFALYPKNCRKIATYLPNKTTYDCVNFYYNNKCTPEFKEMENRISKRRHPKRVISEGKSKPKPVVEVQSESSEEEEEEEEDTEKDSEQVEWTDDEITSLIGFLQVYGIHFETIAQKLKTKTAQQCESFYNENDEKLNLESYVRTTTRSGRTTGAMPPKPTRRKEVREPKTKESARVAPPTPTEGAKQSRRQSTQPNLTPQPVPQEEATKLDQTEAKKTKKQVSVWTIVEKDTFLDSFLEYGRDWKKIAELIPSKTENQIKNFYQNYKVKLGLAEPPGVKIKKKRRRVSLIFDSEPPELCQLASLAQELADKGSIDLDDYRMSDITDDGYDKRESLTPPPPPSLLNIHPLAEAEYRMNNHFDLLAHASEQNDDGVDLLASMALHQKPPTTVVQAPPPSQANYPSLQDVMINSGIIPNNQQQAAVQPQLYAQQQTRPRSSSIPTTPRSTSSTPPTNKKSTPRSTTRRKSNSTASATTFKNKKSPQQEVASDAFSNPFAMYGMPNFTLPFSPGQFNATSNNYTPSTIEQPTSDLERSKKTSKKSSAKSVSSMGQTSPQHTWLWFNQQDAGKTADKPKPAIDLTSTETLSTTFTPQLANRPVSSAPQAATQNPPAKSSSAAPLHAFSTVLSQPTGSPAVEIKHHASGTEQKNVLDELNRSKPVQTTSIAHTSVANTSSNTNQENVMIEELGRGKISEYQPPLTASWGNAFNTAPQVNNDQGNARYGNQTNTTHGYASGLFSSSSSSSMSSGPQTYQTSSNAFGIPVTNTAMPSHGNISSNPSTTATPAADNRNLFFMMQNSNTTQESNQPRAISQQQNVTVSNVSPPNTPQVTNLFSISPAPHPNPQGNIPVATSISDFTLIFANNPQGNINNFQPNITPSNKKPSE